MLDQSHYAHTHTRADSTTIKHDDMGFGIGRGSLGTDKEGGLTTVRVRPEL